MTRPRRPQVYPFALGVFFVLALAADNGAALLGLDDLARPILTTLGVSLLGWLIARLWLSHPHKHAMLTALWVIAFSIYGRVYEALRGPALAESTALHGAMMAWLSCAWILLARSLRRSSSEWTGVTRYGNLLALILLGETTLRLGLVGFTTGPSVSTPSVVAPPRPTDTPRPTPDIYLLVLDKYSNSRQLRSLYGLDNTPFEDELRARGFVIPAASRTNYVQTFLSLASTLNARYLTDIPAQIGETNRRWSAIYPMIERNTLAEFLQARGYRFVFFPSAFPGTAANATADLQLPDPHSMTREFVVAWERTTALPALHHFWCMTGLCTTNRWPYVPESAAFFDWKFTQIGEVGGRGEPVFVFAHLLVPHEPYIFRRDCSHREPIWPPSDNGVFAPIVGAAYAEQVLCVNRKVLSLVDTILKRSTVPPLILIQADHGHGRFGRLVPPVDSVSEAQVEERISIFAAYHLPSVAAGEVVDSTTPVNVIRLVLRHYFGADFPRVDDITYWSSWDRPYHFIRVPSQFPNSLTATPSTHGGFGRPR